MGIGFFYNYLDWTNKSLIKHLKSKVNVEPIDINKFVLDVHYKDKFKHKLYMNRVYPSGNASSYNNLRFMLEITKRIENLGIKIINSFNTTFLDYSKTEQSNALEKANIPTPHSILVSDNETAKKLGKMLKFPKVIKMDAGGRALNVFRVNSLKEYQSVILELSSLNHLIHIEDFIQPPGFITRLFLLNHKLKFAYKKSTIGKGQWLGSISHGSKIIPYPDLPKSVARLGIETSKKLNSKILGLDIIETKKKAYVIDINSTPAFNENEKKIFGLDPVKETANYIFSEYKKIK